LKSTRAEPGTAGILVGLRRDPAVAGQAAPPTAALYLLALRERPAPGGRDGSIGKKIRNILEALKPEAVDFTEYESHRGAIMIVNVDDPSKVPAFAEPGFLTFNANCAFHIMMTPEDLAKAGLDELGRKWP
jgi:hypothetical protein